MDSTYWRRRKERRNGLWILFRIKESQYGTSLLEFEVDVLMLSESGEETFGVL